MQTIDDETFVVLCVSLVIVSATITPIMRHLYDPTKRYTVYKRRTILLSKPDSELCILACLHDEENLPTTINILEAINPTKRTPICIYALHLVELVGRLDPLLISHKLMKKPSSKASTSKGIVNAFRLFEQSYGHHIASAHPFTAVAAYPTMHDEVCAMALDKRVSLIIIPFHKSLTDSIVTTELNKKAIRMMNDKILKSAPCSVAIIVDRGLLHSARPALSTWSSYRIAVLFLGGADDREALALGARMAGQPNINLTIVRLLENRQTPGENTSRERNADNDVVSEFRRNLAGNYQVMYMEEVVTDGTGTVAVIRSMENNYELIIVGRCHDTWSPLVLGLSGWHEETELGDVGDMLASADFRGNATILVVQQHNNVKKWRKNKNKDEEDDFTVHE